MINIPSHWKKEPDFIFPPGSGNRAAWVYAHRIAVGFNVMISKSEMDDGSWWLHISVSKPNRLPTWDEMKKVKDEFLGEDTEAFHIIPKKKDFVNVHRFCLHMWSPLGTQTRLPNLQNIKWESIP